MCTCTCSCLRMALAEILGTVKLCYNLYICCKNGFEYFCIYICIGVLALGFKEAWDSLCRLGFNLYWFGGR